MAGMRRWVFRILSALSLVLCVGICVLWVRSYTKASDVGVETEIVIDGPRSSNGLSRILHRTYSLASDRRGISYSVERRGSFNLLGRWTVFHYDRLGLDTKDMAPDVGFLGFGYRDGTVPSTEAWRDVTWREWTMPYWSLVLLLACLPTVAVMKSLRERHRRRPGHCPACGYDLRATPDRCPECGAAPVTK
jgi:hypothetical protein